MKYKRKWLIGLITILMLSIMLMSCTININDIAFSKYGEEYVVKITPINNYGIVLYWMLQNTNTGERAILAPSEDIHIFDDHIEVETTEVYLVCDTEEGIKVGAKTKLPIGEKVTIEVVVVNPSIYHFNLLMIDKVNK